jgi:hypothetical protein
LPVSGYLFQNLQGHRKFSNPSFPFVNPLGPSLATAVPIFGWMKTVVILTALALIGAACSQGDSTSSDSAPPGSVAPTTRDSVPATTQPTPGTSQPAGGDTVGPPAAGLSADLDLLFGNLSDGVDLEAVARIGASGDLKVAWLISDLFRFVRPGATRDSLLAAFAELTGESVFVYNPWFESTNLLIEWDVPEPPRYRELKGLLFTAVDERWAPFFDDPDSEIDYRYLNWGGVRPDDRPLGDVEATCLGGCIPALDDPAVTDAAGGDWYPDGSVVFAVAMGGEARAYPKNMMEVHEMVIDTVGGVRFGMPYCTLCGSAQAYDLESVPNGVEPPVLRTSGLLSRSNKVMYDLNTWSAFDTFTGRAVSGPLREAGVTLQQLTVVTATWRDWKEAHPETTIVARDGGIGRTYPRDPLDGRDDNGPIFPVGPVDPRLPVQELVLGVETPSGGFIAFPVDAARNALEAGSSVEFGGIRVVPDADGLRAELVDGTPLISHEAFWFAWSQFHPDTELWEDGSL